MGILVLLHAIASATEQEVKLEDWHAGKIGDKLGINIFTHTVIKGNKQYSGIGLAYAWRGMMAIQQAVDFFVYKKIREKCSLLPEDCERVFLEFFLDDTGIVLNSEDELNQAIIHSHNLFVAWQASYRDTIKSNGETLLKAAKDYRDWSKEFSDDHLLNTFVTSKRLDKQSAQFIKFLKSYALEEKAILSPLSILSLVLQFPAFEFNGQIGVRQLLFCLHPDRLGDLQNEQKMKDFVGHLWAIVDALKPFE